MADADAPKAPASLLAELQGDKRASLSHVHTREESGLDQAKVLSAIKGDHKRRLSHVATAEKNKLPTKEDIDAEKADA